MHTVTVIASPINFSRPALAVPPFQLYLEGDAVTGDGARFAQLQHGVVEGQVTVLGVGLWT